MAEKKGGKIAEQVRSLAMPVCEELGLSLWDVRYEKEGATRYLRVLIDRESGLDMNACEEFSRRFNEILDKADPIDEAYVFEAGSPGLGRKLRLPEHFKAYIGEKVRVGFYKPQDGAKEFAGTLTSYDEVNKAITLDDEKTMAVSDLAFVRAADDEIF